MTYDRAFVQVGKNTDFQKSIQKYKINMHVSDPRKPDENPAKGAMIRIKKR